MDRIIITKTGDKFFIDEEDWDLIKDITWVANKKPKTVYAHGLIKGQKTIISMHRLIMNPPPHLEIDHIDGDGHNNRRINLRICTHLQNCKNQHKWKKKTSKFKGVWFETKAKKWRTVCKSNGEKHSGGYFDTEIEAAIAYNKMAKALHGEFANINIIVNPF